MAKPKKLNGSFSTETLLDSIQEIAESEALNGEQIIDILRESFDIAYRDYCSNGLKSNMQDIMTETRVDLNSKKGKVKIYQLYNVVPTDDDVEDDMLQVGLEEALVFDKKAKVGGIAKQLVNLEELLNEQVFIRRIVQSFKQKFNEENKKSLNETYLQLVGKIITGDVEKIDEEKGNVTLNFGKTNAVLRKAQQLPTDKFKLGQRNVKVYLENVSQDSGKKGNPLVISRTNVNFVKKLLEAEVSEVYDGTVEVVKIARKPGLRSKVVVKSNDPNVNPVTACIGGGSIRNSTIQEILNGERIDIIKYEPTIELQIIEAMKPVNIVGLKMPDKEGDPAIVVCNNGDKTIAIGVSGSNVTLASQLVNIKLVIKEVDDALKEGVLYRTVSSITNDIEFQQKLEQADLFEETSNLNDIKDLVVSSNEETSLFDQIIEETTSEAKADEVVEKIEIKGKAKKSLEQIEQELEQERNAKKQVQQPKKKVVKEESKPNVVTEPKKEEVNNLPIYSEDELDEYDDEDFEFDDFEEDYDYSEEDEAYDLFYNK